MTDPSSALGPVPSAERITVVDCLRGAALFGILAANMRGFAAPAEAYMRPELLWSGIDLFVQSLVDWLISGKFITIFSALFGAGFAILMERAAARGYGASFYLRRMTVLLAIGVIHAFLIWWGDILVSYALCGFFLVLFRRRAQRTVFWWGQGLYWLVILAFLAFYIAMLAGAPPPEFAPATPEQVQQSIQTYSSGSFVEIARLRAREWAMLNSFVLFLTRILGMFLFGVWIWRQGYLQRPVDHLDWWRAAWRWGLPLGIVGNGMTAAAVYWFGVDPLAISAVTIILFAVQSAAVPALSLAYAAAIVLLYQDEAWRARLQPFSYVGRMALTNYLMQSVVCTMLFYSYGLGLFGRVGPALALPLAVVVYALQVPISKWWLDRHPYGPVEWLWRRLTYGNFSRQPVATGTRLSG
jgi:uncharacterized protein